MQHLIELKGQPVAPAKLGKVEAPAETKPAPKPEPAKIEVKPLASAPVVAPQTPVASAIAATSTVASASAEKPAKPAAKPAVAHKVVSPPPSLLDDPLYLAGGAAALLALGGLGFMLARRGKGGKPKKKISWSREEVKDIGATARISAPVAPSPETGDFTQAATAAPTSPAQPEDIDPINEADLFLSFGRDAQAEEILKDALEKNPASNPIRVKLLSIHANRKDPKLFSVIARQVLDSGDAAAWAQVAEMGRNLEPDNPMYGGTGGEPMIAAPADQGKGEQQQAAGLDFDLGFGAPEASATAENEGTVAPSEKTATMSGLDFDLGLSEPSSPEANTVEDFASTMVLNAPLGEKAMVTPSADLHAAQEAPMDFDITAPSVVPEPEQAAAITPDLDDLVFDITATHPSLAAITEEKPAASASGADEGLAFTLDFPTTTESAPAQAAAKEAVDIDLSGISLDMGEPTSSASAPAEDVKDAHWHDVATKLDLAKAYQEMGDNAGAREILEEVLVEGDDQQRAAAEEILQQLLV